MKIYKVLPDLDKERHLKIWHKALRSQWSATDLDCQTPQRITSRRLKDRLGRIRSQTLDLLVVPGAGHNDSYIVIGADYFKRIADFVEGCTGERGGGTP